MLAYDPPVTRLDHFPPRFKYGPIVADYFTRPHRPAERLQRMYSKPALVRFAVLAILVPLAFFAMIASVVGQAPPNLPPAGAYQPIPNFVGVGAGAQFRAAINARFAGTQRMAPAIATSLFAGLPLEQDGMLIYCVDCKLTSPCAGSGSGAWALGARGQWTCASGALEANLNANGNKLTGLASGTVGGDALVFGQSAGSDLSGALPNPIVHTVLGGRTPIYSNQPNAALNDSALPALGAATKVQGNGIANITLNKPSTVVAGHTMLMGYYSQSSAAPTAPSGWTLIRIDSCGGGAMGSYYKVAGGSEPASYTWTLGSSYYGAALLDVGVTAANPVDVISPATCGSTPTLASLGTSTQPETVVVFGAGTNGNVSQVTFSQGSLATLQPAVGGVPFSSGYLTANYATTPSLTMSGSGAALAAQMIAVKPANAYSSSPVLQGDGYAELTALGGAAGANSSINGFNIDGRFNVKNPIYGARGDGLSDDTAAIQSAQTAACTQAISTATPQTLWFPAGTYITSFSLISNCSQPVMWKCESEAACNIKGTGLYPLILHEGSTYLSGILANGALTAASLATGTGTSLNWGVNSAQFYDLRDAQSANGPTGWSNAQPINGAAALSVEGFFNYAGGGSGVNYIFESEGGDFGGGTPGTSAVDLHLVDGSPNQIAGCITTTGSGRVCTSSGGSITAGTTYEFQWSYDGSELRIFEGVPGGTTTLAASAAASGTIVQNPSEVFALGDGGSGLVITGWNFQTTNHWIGQLDSIRVSNIARNTSTYTAPTAKFASDSHTYVLMNNLAQSNVLVEATNVAGLNAVNSPVWLPLHSTILSGGNNRAGFYNLGLFGGNYGILAIGTLVTTLDHVNAGGASADEIKLWNESYGTVINHLTVTPATYAESGLVISGNSGLVDMNWLDETGGYYGIELFDAGGTYSELFINPGANTIAGIDAAGTSTYDSYAITQVAIDFENGGAEVPVKLWGSGDFEFYGGNFQDGGNNAFQIYPGNVALALSIFGGNVLTGSSPSPLISWKGSTPPQTPALWVNPLVNGKSLSSSGVPLSDNLAYVMALGDVNILPQKTVATLPGCGAGQTGWQVQIIDCNANCTTYLGTTFTGGGTTRSTVQCNGTAWELH